MNENQVFDERLADRFGRVHNSLRISVTDRCNIRCFYCMPAEGVVFKSRREILRFEEIVRFVQVVAGMGVDRLRITGGEPLVRSDLDRLIEQLIAVPGIREVALTTNGMLLARHAQRLKDAGLDRINISLDTMREEVFQQISRRPGLDQVFQGIAAAQRVGFRKLRLNAIALRGITEDEAAPLCRFARRQGLHLRFIEFMPLDADSRWQTDHVLTGRQLREILQAEFGPLTPVERDDPSQPAVDYRYADRMGQVGFINSVTEPFCQSCNRLRLTAEGQVRNCLFSDEEWDVRSLIRGGGSDDEIAHVVRDCVGAKKAGHGSDDISFVRPTRAMYQIGG